jgi:hypothetical protein
MFDMGEFARSELRQEVVAALIDTGAINLEAAGAVFSKYGERAIRGGDELVLAIGLHNLWACGWPGPEIRDLGVNLRQG